MKQSTDKVQFQVEEFLSRQIRVIRVFEMCYNARDRQHLSQDGLIVIVLTMDSRLLEKLLQVLNIISEGFVYVKSENLMDDIKSVVRHEIRNVNRIRD